MSTVNPMDFYDLRSLLDEAGTAGNLTTDAQLAALAVTHGATLVTCDADFARFRSLKCENPTRCEG